MLNVFRLLSIAIAAGLVLLMLHAGEPSDIWWWLLAIPFGCWIIGPAVVPYLIARRASRRWQALAWLGLFAISTAWSAWFYYRAFFVSQSSTASLVMIFIPLYQWTAVGIMLAAFGMHAVWSRAQR